MIFKNVFVFAASENEALWEAFVSTDDNFSTSCEPQERLELSLNHFNVSMSN